ncbi:kelch repeat-containing protein [Corallococcus sp. 4LFB]|uniref:kelch repeat-containing protein n=1 Tax=Corallococcus sp. 4LFB TaxID=3383249 RepID=UPI0039756250
MAVARYGHIAVPLGNGSQVLVAGGWGVDGPLRSAELYDVARGTWKTVAPMSLPRYLPHATVLPSGRVLVVTGEGGSGAGRARLRGGV